MRTNASTRACRATFTYQTTDPATNQVTALEYACERWGGATQSFVFALTPTAPIAPTICSLALMCEHRSGAHQRWTENTLRFRLHHPGSRHCGIGGRHSPMMARDIPGATDTEPLPWPR